jgi:hypothetical protein
MGAVLDVEVEGCVLPHPARMSATANVNNEANRNLWVLGAIGMLAIIADA